MPTLSALFTYPVKSCAGVALREAVLTPHGLEYDRHWMLVDARGRMLTQRSHGRLAQIRAAPGDTDLVVSAPGMPPLHTPLAVADLGEPAIVEATVWDDTVRAFDTGAASAAWFSRFLGLPVRLVRFDPAAQRIADPFWTGEIRALAQFSDGFPLLATSSASLAELNARLAAKGAPPIPMNRFRPNLVIDGLAPYEEDYVERLTMRVDGAPVALRLVKPCARCPIPTLDQDSGLPHPDWPHEPLDTLATYRADARVGGGITFGQNAVIETGIGVRLACGLPVDAELAFGD